MDRIAKKELKTTAKIGHFSLSKQNKKCKENDEEGKKHTMNRIFHISEHNANLRIHLMLLVCNKSHADF